MTRPTHHAIAFRISIGVVVALAASMIAAADEPPEEIPINDLLTKGKSLYGQEKQELIIRHFFRDRRDGFYVDVGCYHWKKASTTYYLEEHLGWSGIGIDPQIMFADGWKKHRPRSKFMPYAVTDKSGETIKFFQAGGLSATDSTNLEKWQEVIDVEPVEITVPTITLNDLLDQEGVKSIDFFSMDINGAEVDALKGFDIKRFMPELVHIEASRQNKPFVADYFDRNGYKRIDEYLEHDPINWYFTPKSSGSQE